MKRDLNSSVTPTLAAIDRTILIGVPLIAATAVIHFPDGSTTSLRVLAGFLVMAWGLALLGWRGRAPWRRSAYPVMVLALGTIGFWSQGPTAGVGAAFGLAVLLAGALCSRIGLWMIVAACVVTVTLGAFGLPRGVTFEVTSLKLGGLAAWVRIALTVGVIAWIATRVLGTLLESLELSYEHAVEAYRNETATQVQLKSSRQELDEVEHVELVGRLAGGVAHDINNALTAILAASDLLGDKVATEGQRRSLTELEAASRHAAELVRDLLWIGRKFPPTTTTTQVEPTVRACLRRLERMGRKIELVVDVPVLCVALAPERLEQVLFWVVLRARRAGINQLSVTARRRTSMIEIDVRGVESGHGPSTSLTFRPKAVSARLGMSAAKEVVEQAGGSFTVIEGDGRLWVQVCIPPARGERTHTAPLLDRQRTALVVDDEPLVLGRLSKLVARRGYTVMSASSLAEAWPLLAAGPDLLVTDLQLGDGRGEDLAIASFAGAPERPIVVCSGFGADDTLRDQLRQAHVQFLTKPFTMAELEGAIPLALRRAA